MAWNRALAVLYSSMPTDTSEKGRHMGEKKNLGLEEYTMAAQIQEKYYDVVARGVIIYLAITAVSLGFVFRESISDQLRVLFCWFNIGVSLFAFLAYLRLYIVSRRIAQRMDKLGSSLGFELPHHHTLSYGILVAMLAGFGVWIFWFAALFFRFWSR